MNKTIKIRAYYGDWKEVDIETAQNFVKKMLPGIVTVSTFEGKAAIIDSRHLRGIPTAELMKPRKDEL